MANFGAGFGSLGGAVSDIFGAVGDWAESKSYGDAARMAKENAQLTTESTALQEYQATRQITQTQGATASAEAGAGFEKSGSGADILRSGAQQGELTKQLVQINGQQQELGYLSQAAQFQGMQEAAKQAANGGLFGGIASGIAAAFSFSDWRLKEHITYSMPSPVDGVALYTFYYLGGTVLYEGVIAQEVQQVRPECVKEDENGWLMVDYDRLGVPLRIAGVA